MNRTYRNEVGTVLLVELLKVRNVLEVVGIKAALDNACVGCDGVFDLDDLKCDALVCEYGLYLLKDLGVRCDAGADFDRGALGILVR